MRTSREQAERRIEWVEANLARVAKCTSMTERQLRAIDPMLISDIRAALDYSCKTASCDIWCSINKTYKLLTQ